MVCRILNSVVLLGLTLFAPAPCFAGEPIIIPFRYGDTVAVMDGSNSFVLLFSGHADPVAFMSRAHFGLCLFDSLDKLNEAIIPAGENFGPQDHDPQAYAAVDRKVWESKGDPVIFGGRGIRWSPSGRKSGFLYIGNIQKPAMIAILDQRHTITPLDARDFVDKRTHEINSRRVEKEAMSTAIEILDGRDRERLSPGGSR